MPSLVFTLDAFASVSSFKDSYHVGLWLVMIDIDDQFDKIQSHSGNTPVGMSVRKFLDQYN